MISTTQIANQVFGLDSGRNPTVRRALRLAGCTPVINSAGRRAEMWGDGAVEIVREYVEKLKMKKTTAEANGPTTPLAALEQAAKLPRKHPRTQLPLLQSSRLLVLVQDEYKTKLMDDVEFAAYATKKLGFDVKDTHVKGRRDALGIPSTRALKASVPASDTNTLLNLIAALEQRLAALEAR